MARIYQNVRGNRPGRSVFDLSYSKVFTCDMGELIPVCAEEVIPGDSFQLGAQMTIRFMPLVAPILHPIYATVHYFFVPYRVLCGHEDVDVDWEAFITGGSAGTDATVLPTWNVTTNTVGSLWDYLGFPLGVDNADARPLAFPQIAYNMIWNEYYRDENVQTEVTVDTQEAILNACWSKGYFESALPWLQRGTTPALSISGTLSTAWPDAAIVNDNVAVQTTFGFKDAAEADGILHVYKSADDDPRNNARDFFTRGTVDLSGASTFDLADLRLAIAVQRWMELNARGGARLVEFTKAHFGVQMPDYRAQRPEYIGGLKVPVIISEVLQTSETSGTPQGTMVGHGIALARQMCAKVRVSEFGLVMGILCVRPVPMYHQGINRQWLRETRYDFYNPAFAGLSEQAIETRELYCDAANELVIFGYQGRYDEMRTKPNMVCGDMHADYDHWHLCRQFSAQPTLSSSFLTCTPRKDIFAAPAEDGLLVHFGNIIKAVRPIPAMAQPGMGVL